MARTDGDSTLGLRRRVWLVAALVLGGVIAIASVLPPRGTPVAEIADLGEIRAWAGHAIGYLLLTAAALCAQARPRPWTTLLIAVGYGVLLEAVQGLIGLRSAQLADVVANAVGALVGVGVGLWLRRRW